MSIKIDFAYNLKIKPEKICSFYSDNWKRQIVLNIPEFYKWQFIDAPDNKLKDNVCLAVNNSNEILGVMGLNKRTFYLNTKPFSGAELTTWIISPKSKGLGIGGKILRFLQDNFSILFGSSITAEAIPLYLKSGCYYSKAIPRFVKVWDIDYLEKFTEVNKLTKQLINKRRKVHANISYHLKPFNKTNLDKCNKSLLSQFNSYSRSYEYLKWRLLSHPYYSYEIYIVQKNQKQCCIVLRLDNIKGGKFLYVSDFFGDIEAMDAAQQFIEEYCIKHNIQIAEFFCSTPKVSRFFVNSGWFSILDETFINFPHLFYPVELRTPPSSSLIMWSKENRLDLIDLSKLYISKQDLDLDRPTIYYLKQNKLYDEQ